MSRIVSFRGQLANDAVETIHLHTTNGSIGYRIVKVETISADPGAYDEENIFKIYTIDQAAVDAQVDFSDQTLLGVSFMQTGTAATKTASTTIVFDNKTFNQDIYLTAKDVGGSSRGINYHIELEQVSLDLNENTVATLKDIRNIGSSV